VEATDMTYLAWLIFVGAAILEVGGDAVVRKGLRGSNLMIIMVGFAEVSVLFGLDLRVWMTCYEDWISGVRSHSIEF